MAVTKSALFASLLFASLASSLWSVPAGAADLACSEELTDSNYREFEITEDTRLMPKNAKGEACVYRAHFRIQNATKSGITLDCQGAHILGSRGDEERSWEASLPPVPQTEEENVSPRPSPPRPLYGILIGGHDITTALQNITVKNCVVEGFERNFGVEVGTAIDNASAESTGISFLDSKSVNARVYGVYLGTNVANVLMRKMEIQGSQASGLFWSTESHRNTLVGSKIIGNGKNQSMPHQDGLTLDSSYRNQVVANLFENNGMSAVALFKNCGEFGSPRPKADSDNNTFRANHFKLEKIGVWLGARQSMNQQHLSCSAAKTFDDSHWDIVEDFAKDNSLQKNIFTEVGIGARVEDDRNQITENTFKSSNSQSLAVLIGSRFGRPRALRRPVEGVRIEKNSAQIPGSKAFQYCFLQASTEMIGNFLNGKEVPKLSLASDRCGIHEGPMGDPVPVEAIEAPPARGLASEGKATPPTPKIQDPQE